MSQTRMSDEDAEMSSIKTGSGSERGSSRQNSTLFGPTVSEPGTPGSVKREGSAYFSSGNNSNNTNNKKSGSETFGSDNNLNRVASQPPGSMTNNNNTTTAAGSAIKPGASIVIKKKKSAIKRVGSRLLMEEDDLERKRLEDLTKPGATTDDEEEEDGGKNENAATKLIKAVSRLPWFIRRGDPPSESAKKISLIDHLLNSITIGLPMMVAVATGIKNKDTISKSGGEADRPHVTAIVTVIAFALMFILPWCFWIGINAQNDSEYEDAVKAAETAARSEDHGNNAAAALLQNAMKRASSNQNINNQNNNNNSAASLLNHNNSMSFGTGGRLVNSDSHEASSPIKNYSSMDGAKFADATNHLQNNNSNNKNPNTAKKGDAASLISGYKDKKVKRPIINETVIDILTVIMMCLSTVVGICWYGVSFSVIIINIRIFARGSRAAGTFMLKTIQAPIFLAGTVYLIVKAAQEAGLVSQQVVVAPSTVFAFAPGSPQDIVMIVVTCIQLLLIMIYVNTGNILLHVASSKIQQFVDQQRARTKTLTQGEQHVAGGIVGNLVRLEISAAKRIAEKYIGADSPTMLRGLSQLVSNMEQYITFVPAWVKNPNALEEEEQAEETDNTDLDLNQSENWSQSESLRSHNSMFGNMSHSGSAKQSALTRENMMKVGGGSSHHMMNNNNSNAHNNNNNTPGKNNNNNNAAGDAAGVFGEYNLEYEDEKDDDLISVRDGDNDDDKNHVKVGGGGGGADAAGNHLKKLAAATAGFAGKVVIATVEFNLNFKTYNNAKRTDSFKENPLHQLPNSIPDPITTTPGQHYEATNASASPNSLAGNSGGGDEISQTDVEKQIIDKICGIIATSGGILHSIVANKIIVSWNTMSRIAAPEHKAVRFLVMSRKIATDKDSPFPGLMLSGACMTGYGRAMIATAGSSLTSVVSVRWWRELEILGALAAQEDTLLCDLATKHAVFLEFSVRGCGCLGNKNTMEIPKGDMHNKSMAVRHAAQQAEKSLPNRTASAINRTPSMQNLHRSGSSLIDEAMSGGSIIAIKKSSQQPQAAPAPMVSPKEENPLTHVTTSVSQKDTELLAVFSIIGKRTGNNVEWMYLLQGGDEDSGAADPAAVSCSAIDHAAAGNFGTAKQYVDQAVKLCEKEAIDLAKKVADSMKNTSMNQRQRDEADLIEEQQCANQQSLEMFRKLSKRLETNNTMEMFPYRLAVL